MKLYYSEKQFKKFDCNRKPKVLYGNEKCHLWQKSSRNSYLKDLHQVLNKTVWGLIYFV